MPGTLGGMCHGDMAQLGWYERVIVNTGGIVELALTLKRLLYLIGV